MMGKTVHNNVDTSSLPAVVLAFVCLLSVTLVSSIVVVSVAYQSRQHVGQLKHLKQGNARAHARASRLRLEYSTLAEFGRVERRAMSELSMHQVLSDDMVVLP